MSRFRFRTVGPEARRGAGGFSARKLERLESRCVLSANPFYAMHGISASPHFGAEGQFVQAPVGQDARLGNSRPEMFSSDADRLGSHVVSDGAFNAIDFNPHPSSAFNQAGAVSNSDFDAPKFEVTVIVAQSPRFYDGGIIGWQQQVVAIYGNWLPSAPGNFVDMSAPMLAGASGPHPDITPSIVNRQSIAPEAPLRSLSSAVSNVPIGPSQVQAPVGEMLASVRTSLSASGIGHVVIAQAAAYQTASSTIRYAGFLPERSIIHITQDQGFAQILATAEAIKQQFGSAIAGLSLQQTEGGQVPTDPTFDAAQPPPTAAAEAPGNHVSLAGLSINLPGMEQALKTVLRRFGTLGAELHDWLDDARLAPMIGAVAGATLAAGGAYYLRQRGGHAANEQNEEASSSWLFARLQPLPSE